ncbi:MAG: DNA polymerase III subunit chi [Lactobacillus sp.]|jgi:DNA polymerase-3 subunit chi|nr:DNA polymerase III subunit chi [Lactobacillus sp.]
MKADFYHLQKQTLEEVLPKLLDKAYETGKKIVLRIGNEERVEFINSMLWTFDEFSFLPHGSKKDGNAPLQPIWLTSGDDNPNNADFLFLIDGASINPSEFESFERVFNIFDGNSEEALVQARSLWKTLKEHDIASSYWQQENGKWVNKG